MFISSLLTVARTWKQPRCPLTNEWIKKVWYIYTMEHYSAIKRNTCESVLMRWLNLGPVKQSEVSQKEKDKCCILHWKRLWCWEGLGAGGEGDDREWDGWMTSLTQWTWVWVNSRSRWWTGRPGMLWFMGSQRVRHDWATELNWVTLQGTV